MARLWTLLMLLVLAMTRDEIRVAEAGELGVAYGFMGDNLPPPAQVVDLYKRNGITTMRILEPRLEVLDAVLGSGIKVILGVKNADIPSLADPALAAQWFQQYAEPYLSILSFIAVGNECVPNQYTATIVQAMQNIQDILNNRPGTHIGVSTVVNPKNVMRVSTYLPSEAAFADGARDEMIAVLHFLSRYGWPLMVNVYPYVAYVSNPADIPSNYAMFTANEPFVRDGPYNYLNLYDAMLDCFYVAMERAAGVTNIAVMVTESGWPSDGSWKGYTTPKLAGIYNRNFVNHVRTSKGTPRRPEKAVDGIIFAMFNENQKPKGEGQHWGLFYPDMRPVYPVFPAMAHHKYNKTGSIWA